MDEKLKKRSEEVDNEYIGRIYRNKCEYELTNTMCKDVINEELGTEYAESTLRGIAKIFNETYELISERLLNKDNTEYLKELEEKKKELEKERIKIRTEKIDDKIKLAIHQCKSKNLELNRLNLTKNGLSESTYFKYKSAVENWIRILS